MQHLQMTTSGELVIIPSPASSKHDFDFLLGPHKVHHKKLKSRLSNCTEWIEFDGEHTMRSLLDSAGNLEEHIMPAADGKQVKGIALRLFDPLTKLWSIYWADSQAAVLDVPVKGSFDNGIGYFFTQDTLNGKPILVQFKWDATDPQRPVWSQAFSADNGATWEWNWYMYFSKENQQTSISVLELRNYVIKTGRRDEFADYFESQLIAPQAELHGYPLGQYKVKGQPDNFCWLRGFEDLQARSKFLPAFYHGPVWQQHRSTANSMLANNDNVHLLRPVTLQGDSLKPARSVASTALLPGKGILVLEFYTANTRLPQLLQFFATQYLPLMEQCNVKDYTLWTAELSENDFPALPVFQDKNLLLSITRYNDELDYSGKQEKLRAAISEEMNAAMQDLITFKNILILYPTAKTAAL